MTDKALTVRSNESSLPAMAGNPIANALDAAEKLGQWMAGSGMFACKTREQGQVMAITCITEGITPLQFARTYDVIQTSNGIQVCLKAQAMLAKLVSFGGDYEILESTDKLCRILFSWTRNGKPKTAEYTYSIEDAQKAGLIKKDGSYEKRPKTMLFNRCASNGLRLHVSEYFSGYYLAEELLDTPPSPHQGPTPESTDKVARRPDKPDKPDKGPTTLEAQFSVSSAPAEEPPPEQDQPPVDEPLPVAEQSLSDLLLFKQLKLNHVLSFLRDSLNWITEADIEHKPVAAVINSLPADKQERIRNGINAFAEKVDAYAFSKGLGDESETAGEPEPEEFPNEIKTPKKRGRKKKEDEKEGKE